MVAMNKESIQAAKIEEASVLIDDVTGSAVLLTNGGTLPLNWKARILRIVLTNRDNGVLLVSIYVGEVGGTEERTLLKQIFLANYATRVLEVLHPEEDQINAWESRTSGESNVLYGILGSAPTAGVLVEQLDWVMEEG